ncbi:MAG: AMP-binding protein [Planctomycetota bacterium]
MSPPHDVWSILERAADAWPDAVAYAGPGGEEVRWSEAARRIDALARGLARVGVGPGERVALGELNSATFLEVTFATLGLGATLVPLNTRLARREVAEVLTDAAPRVLLANGAFVDTLGARDLPTWWIGDEAPAGAARLAALYAAPAAGHDAALGFEPHVCAPADPAFLYYTSGTTGRAKGVILTHKNVVRHAEAATTELDLASDDVWGHVAPMFHLADAWATLAITLVGGRHVFLPRFDPSAACALFAAAGVTVTNLVPTMLQRMLAAAPGAGFEGGALRLVLSGGAPIAPATVRAVLETFRCEYVQTYGLTETSPYLTLSVLEARHRALDLDAQIKRRARTGRPFETVELDVVDDDGKPVPRDDATVGEVIARGDTVTPGYWNRPEETARAFRDGWFRTGDLATIDAEGWLNVVDRAKDVILSGGENVYSAEVEAALLEHPAVLEVAAYGAPHPEWGEEVRAAVVLKDGRHATAAELRAFCRERLAGYKVPKLIELMLDLPRTGSGKVAKRLLRDAAGGA